jgi:hypothetical protein
MEEFRFPPMTMRAEAACGWKSIPRVDSVLSEVRKKEYNKSVHELFGTKLQSGKRSDKALRDAASSSQTDSRR